MKNNTKLLIAAGLSVAALVGVFAFVLTLPSHKEEVIYTPDSSILLYDKQTLVPEDITVKQTDSEYQLLGYSYTPSKSSTVSTASSQASDQSSIPVINPEDSENEEEIPVIYTMQEYEQENLSKDMTGKLYKACRYLTATSIIDKSGKKDKEYGIDKPRTEVRVVFNDGSVIGFRIGSETTDKSSSYLKMDGSKNIYLIKNEDVEIFLKNKLQMLDLKITGSRPDDFILESIHVSSHNDKEGFTVVPNSTKLSEGAYMLDKPYRAACSDNSVNSILTGLFNLSASEVVAVDPSDKDLISYGLDDPYSEIEMLFQNGGIKLLMSEKDSNGNCYLTSGSGAKVFRIEASVIDSFYGIGLNDVIDKSLIRPDQTRIDCIEIKDGKAISTFVYKREKKITENYMENIVTTISCLDKQIDTGNMSKYLNNMEAIVRTDSAPESLKDCREIYGITFYYVDNDSITDNLSFYRTPDNKTFAVVNDRIECYVDGKLADKLIDQTSSLSGNDDIEPFIDENSNI